MELKNRRMQSIRTTKGRGKSVQGELKTTIGKREECRMEERDAPHAQRPRGPVDSFTCNKK